MLSDRRRGVERDPARRLTSDFAFEERYDEGNHESVKEMMVKTLLDRCIAASLMVFLNRKIG